MRVLIINGSPRPQGNSTHIALQLQQEMMSINTKLSCDIIKVANLNIQPCTGCEQCSYTAECVLKDDMQQLYQQVIDSDLLIFVTPIYFGSVTAQLKAFIDRFQPFYGAKYLLERPKISPENNKRASLIAISGRNRQKFYDNAEGILEIFCLNSNIELTDGLYLSDIDEPGEVIHRPEAVNKIKELARLLLN